MEDQQKVGKLLEGLSKGFASKESLGSDGSKRSHMEQDLPAQFNFRCKKDVLDITWPCATNEKKKKIFSGSSISASTQKEK